MNTPETNYAHFLDPVGAEMLMTAARKLLPPGYTLGVNKSSIFFAHGEGTDRINYIMFDQDRTYPTQIAVLDLLTWVMNASYLAGFAAGHNLPSLT